MQILISDANILIDMEEGNLIEELFRLPYVFSIPDILFYEEMEEEHQYLIDLELLPKKEAVVVMGTIWVVTQLVRHQVINVVDARTAYEKMRVSGRRLPWILEKSNIL